MYASDLEGVNNMKGNVLINNKPTLKSVQSLFSNYQIKSSSSIGDTEMTPDDENGCNLNATIVQNM